MLKLTQLSKKISFLILLNFMTAVVAAEFPGENNANPNEPDSVGVLIANGLYDPSDSSYIPPTPDDFDTLIMGRDAIEKQQRRDLAIDYFIDRFGIDFTANDFLISKGFQPVATTPQS